MFGGCHILTLFNVADVIPHTTAGCKRAIGSYPREGTDGYAVKFYSFSAVRELNSRGTLERLNKIHNVCRHLQLTNVTGKYF